MQTINHWIAGRPEAEPSSAMLDVTDPATGKACAKVPLASAALVDMTVAAARSAFKNWRDVTLLRRQRIMFAFRELVSRHHDDLARLVTAELGKTFEDARGEVQRGLEVVEFACGLPHLAKGELSEQLATGIDAYSFRQPLGVCAGITPFNFPVMVPMWMFPVAIACGNTFILKPSEKDPSASTRLAELLTEAGVPDGVFNVVHGDQAAVNAILDHPDIDAVSFVGSTGVARHVYATAASNGKRVQALGGAKNHMVVLPDADLDQAADAAVSAGYGAAGERCMAISVVVAVGGVADPLIDKISDRARALRIGPGSDGASQMGPLVTREHLQRVRGYVDRGLAEGAELIVDGRDLVIKGHEGGHFLGPCLFDHVTPGMTIYRDEVFGPVLSVVRAETYNDAIDLINDNPYGNGTAIFTNDGGAARRFQHEVTAGMIGINVPIPVPQAAYSFGGWKDSIFGGHSVYGPDAVRFYTQQKTVTSRWPNPSERGIDLGFPEHR